MTNWTEVNVYTGRPVDEDAPTNFAGTGSGVDMNPTGMRKKKKKLVDARTKSYKTHRAKLETARVKREAKRNGVKEEVELDEFKKVRFEFKDKKDMMKAVKDLEKQGHKVEKGKMSLTVTAKRGHDLNRQAIDIVNFYGAKANAMYESVEEETLDEAMDKKTAIEILKMKKKEDFYGRDGAMIYMSPDERDALKKKVGRLGRDIPGSSKGVSTMIIINNALGKDGTDGNRGDYDTEGKKMISYKKGGKSIGTPRTIGDAMKLAGIREEVEKTFSQKVKESVSNFNVESLLAEDNVDVLRSIVKNKAMKPIKLKDGAMKVDLFTASAIVQVLDKIKPANKIKLTKMLNGKKSDFMRASEGIMKMIGKR